MLNNIGKARRAYALTAGSFTQDDAAKFFHVAPATYRKWEQGRTSVRDERLGEIADKYNVTVDYLLNRGCGDVERGGADVDELLRRFTQLNFAGRARLLEDAAILGESNRYTARR